jgi:hypothetical protein
MPVCHGSGGLAAQYRFGARSGSSIILLGLFKILLGLLFGESLVGLLRGYPKGLLGVMVLAAGLELAKVGESLNYGARDLWEGWESNSTQEPGGLRRQRSLSDEERKERWMVMFMTIGGLLAFKNDGVGFVAGMLCHWTYELSNAWTEWGSRRSSAVAGVEAPARKSRRAREVTTIAEEEEQMLLDGDTR